MDNFLKLEPTSKTATLRTSARAKLVNNRFQRSIRMKHNLDGTEDKCQRNRKIRRCIECYRKYSSELDYEKFEMIKCAFNFI